MLFLVVENWTLIVLILDHILQVPPKGPSSSLPPPLFSQCEAHGPPIGVDREKNYHKK